MASNEYRFVTRWRVQGTVDEVFDVLQDPEDLVRWWPSVYLDVRVLERGDEHGVGRIVSLFTKGWLPYTLRWWFRTTEVTKPTAFAIEASGDFVGTGVWTLEQDGTWVHATYDWRIDAEKPLLRRLSFFVRPVFEANHRWAMARGEESLALELRRRHTVGGEQALVPAPPGPTSQRAFLAAG
ncbi:MAG: SRPBCC family protein, partial [Candidatus Dormibacteraeota bacterium]|nr:SRPBCC family protein [Candidatus Dormibacteraeota bacterium]